MAVEYEITGLSFLEHPRVIKDANRDEILDQVLDACEKSPLWDEVGYVENEDPDLITIWRTRYTGDSMESYPAYLRFVDA